LESLDTNFQQVTRIDSFMFIYSKFAEPGFVSWPGLTGKLTLLIARSEVKD